MNPSKVRLVPAQPPQPKPVSRPLQQKNVTVDGEAQAPMSQQDVGDCHGHDMHPQKLVRLVGCHDPHAGKHDE